MDSRSSAPRIRRNIMSNSATHENVITVICFLIGLLVGAWGILVIGRKQGRLFHVPYCKPGLSASSIYETIQASIL
jgi:hypothetical protein